MCLQRALLDKLQPTLLPSLRIEPTCQMRFLELLAMLQQQHASAAHAESALTWIRDGMNLSAG